MQWVSTYIDVRSCGLTPYVAVYQEGGINHVKARSITFVVAHIEERRLWAEFNWPLEVSGGSMALDNEYFANATVLALDPFWPVGPHDGLVGRWARPVDAGATNVSPPEEFIISSDGGGVFTSATESYGGPVADLVDAGYGTAGGLGLFAIDFAWFSPVNGPDGGIEVLVRQPAKFREYRRGLPTYSHE